MAATMARAKAKRAAGTTSPKAEPAPATTEPAVSTISKGDLVWIDYEGWILNPTGTRTLFDTTRSEVAKKEERIDEKKVYAEFPIIVGHGRILPGLDEALVGAEIGKEMTIRIPPEKGAGERDPKLVELHPLREFLKQEIHPDVGMEVSLGGRKGTITQVTGGRVRIDYNNPLAGKTIEYTFRVMKKPETTEDKLRAILEMDYGLPERFKITVGKDRAEILIPDICKTDERWFVSKFRVVADIREVLGLPKVRFVEEYVKAPPRPEPAKAPEKAEEAKAEPEPVKEGKPEERPAPPTPAADVERAEEELPPEEKTPEEL
jgi:FKBP-type peptidyl-prolyl cis-trans isomerase 2